MIIALVPIKSESTRCPGKNFRSFGDTTLTHLKIETLLRVADRVVVNSDSSEVLDWVNKDFRSDKMIFQKRDPFYASSECDNSTLFEFIATEAPEGTMLYAPVTAPFIGVNTYRDALYTYFANDYDCVVSAFNLKEHTWFNGCPVNYDPEDSPNSQDLPDLWVMTYGFGILERDTMIRCRNIIGTTTKNHFYSVSEMEAVDIDTEMDFKYAEYLYEEVVRGV